jgi:hypothetical protein
MSLPPFGQVAEFDRQAAEAVVRIAAFAADAEAMREGPVSRVPGPAGLPQRETPAEKTARVVRTALLHLLEQRLVVLPDDIGTTLDGYIPLDRVGKD